MDPIVVAEELKFYYPAEGSRWVRAVDSVSFTVARGDTFGLVGESGCGKTTLGRVVVGLYKPMAGKVIIEGRPLYQTTKPEAKKIRQKIGIVFQDPYSSLDPRMTIYSIVGEPISVHKLDRGRNRVDRVKELLEKVGLKAEHLYRYPHEFSGGQRQRIAIARALAGEPDFLVLDEPTSALDVSVQAQILNLLKHLQQELGLTYLFISHDLGVIKHLSNTIAVMYMGKIVEMGMIDEVFNSPKHPYTQALLSVIPVPDPDAKKDPIVLKGDVPSLTNPPLGCRFHTRCPYVMPVCMEAEPELLDQSGGHLAACHLLVQPAPRPVQT